MAEGGGQPQQGLSPADLARISQQTSSNAQDPSSFDDLMDALFGWTGSLFTFCKTKADSLFNTGIFAHIQLQQSLAEAPMNKGAASLSMRGGKLAQILAVFKVEFSKVAPPQMGGSMVDVSFASLGNLSAPTFAGVSGQGMGAGFEVG